MTPEEIENAKKQKEEITKQISSLPDGIVKTSLEKTLKELEQMLQSSTRSESSTTTSQVTESRSSSQSGNAPPDNIIGQIDGAALAFHRHQELLALAVHAIVLESGFQLLRFLPKPGVTPIPGFEAPTEAQRDERFVPENWDHRSEDGIFSFTYSLTTDIKAKFALKCLVVDDKLEVYFSPEKAEGFNLELTISNFVDQNQPLESARAANILRNLGELRAKLAQPLQNLSRPSSSSSLWGVGESRPRPGLFIPGSSVPPVPHRPVGGDFDQDLFPMGRRDPFRDPYNPLSGGGSGGSLVGPGHPLLGGPSGLGFPPGAPGIPGVPPGARFDPYGPMGPGIPGGPPPPGQGHPFGEPDPDHLPMPGGEFQRFPPPGRGGGNMRWGGGGGIL